MITTELNGAVHAGAKAHYGIDLPLEADEPLPDVDCDIARLLGAGRVTVG